VSFAAITLCVASQPLSLRLSPETFGYTLVHYLYFQVPTLQSLNCSLFTLYLNPSLTSMNLPTKTSQKLV